MRDVAKAATATHEDVGDGPDAPDRCQVVVVEIDGRRIGIPAEDVLEVQPAAAVTPLAGAPANIDGVLDLRGELIAVLDGRARIGADRRPPRLNDRFVVVRTAARTMAVRVDAAVALSEVTIVDAERGGSLTADVLRGAGLARTVDGLLVVHDVEAFLSVEESADLERALTERQEP